MNYIYDILTNFNEDLIDFFEWNRKDHITRIKKIPIFKISNHDFKTICNNEIIIDQDTTKKICYKTDFWGNNKNKNEESYYMLISDGNDVIGLQLNKMGLVIKRSSLYVDEELEVLDICERLDDESVKYKFINKKGIILKTRKKILEMEFINSEIDKLEKKDDIDKIKYVYFECFNKIENNTKKAINALRNTTNNEHSKEYKELYNFFKLISINNK